MAGCLTCVGTETVGQRETPVMYVITTDTSRNLNTGGPLAARCVLQGAQQPADGQAPAGIRSCNIVDEAAWRPDRRRDAQGRDLLDREPRPGAPRGAGARPVAAPLRRPVHWAGGRIGAGPLRRPRIRTVPDGRGPLTEARRPRPAYRDRAGRDSMRILLTNDDGINAPGLAVAEAIAAELAGPEGEVWVVAPDVRALGRLALHLLCPADPAGRDRRRAATCSTASRPTACWSG